MWRTTSSRVIAATILGMIVAAATVTTFAQTPAKVHRVIVDMARPALAEWDLLLEQIRDLQGIFGPGGVQIEVVARDPAVGWLLAGNTGLQDKIHAAADSGVVFVVGRDSLQRRGLAQNQLLPFVRIVDSGPAEVVRKQEDGWAYINSTPAPATP
jgi:intracellular sulfur oxidation DsrE/DsrF family protein